MYKHKNTYTSYAFTRVQTHIHTHKHIHTQTHTHTCTHKYPHPRTQIYLHTHLDFLKFGNNFRFRCFRAYDDEPPPVHSQNQNNFRFGQCFQIWATISKVRVSVSKVMRPPCCALSRVFPFCAIPNALRNLWKM